MAGFFDGDGRRYAVLEGELVFTLAVRKEDILAEGASGCCDKVRTSARATSAGHAALKFRSAFHCASARSAHPTKQLFTLPHDDLKSKKHWFLAPRDLCLRCPCYHSTRPKTELIHVTALHCRQTESKQPLYPPSSLSSCKLLNFFVKSARAREWGITLLLLAKLPKSST